MTYKRSIKMIAVLVLVTFTVTFGLPTQQVLFAMSQDDIKRTAAEVKYDKPVTATTLGGFVSTMLQYIEAMKGSVDQDDLNKLKNQVKDTKNALKDAQKAIKDELDRNEKTLDALKTSKAKQKHDQFRADLEGKLNGFEVMVDQLDELVVLAKELKGKDCESILNKLGEIEKVLNPEQPQQPLGALPHNNANILPPEPAIGGGIIPAYAVGTQAAASEQALPKVPVDADLTATPETALTQEIKDLTDSLGTPVKIYEYVRNNIDFETYYGSRKGAAGTLNQLAGNDYDQASLLIAMLRYKNIPARYVKGTVEVPIAKVMSMTGGKTPDAAVRIMGSLGVPVISVTSGGKIVAARFEHIWAEAYLPYENYRGAGEMKGQSVWLPLDPGFKQYEVVKGLDVKEISGYTDEQILDAFKLNGERSADGDTITNIDISEMSSLLDDAKEKVQKYIQDNNLENADLKQLMGGRKIIPEKLMLLPNTLPYKTITVLAETNTIPDAASEKIGFSIKGNDPYNLNFTGTDDFNVNFRAVELYGKRITLSWAPATQEDIDIINHYGGIFKTPAYMIQLKPQMMADGQVIAEGKAVGFGNRQEFTIAMGHVGRPVEDVVNPVTVGGFYSVSLDYGKIDVKELQTIKERIDAVKDTATEESIYTDAVMGEILNSVGKAYFGQLDAFDNIVAAASKVNAVRQISEGMTGYRPNVSYMFYTPVEVTGGSFFIDVDHDVIGVTSQEGRRENEIGYMLNTGILGSSMEHVIHEQIFQVPSVSSIKILVEASNRGIPVYTIGQHNINKLNELNVSSSVKADITNAVNSGKIVTIPQKEIRYYNWQGSGYIVTDPETGAAGYMISGGIAGGSAAIDIAVTLIGLVALVWAIYDTLTIAMALLAVTNPLAGVLFGTLLLLNIINVISTLNNIIMYWQTGDYRYAAQLLTDLLMNIAFMSVFKALEWVAPGIMSLFKNVKNSMDEIAEIAAKYGDDVAEVAARYGPDAVKAINQYGADAGRAIMNYGDDALQLIKLYGADAVSAIKNYGDDAINVIKRYGDDALRVINQHGADAVKAIVDYGDAGLQIILKYGNDGLYAITNFGGEAVRAITRHGDDAMRLIKQFGRDAAETIALYGDDAIRNIDRYGEDGLIAFIAYGDDLVQSIGKFGDDAVGSVIKYGDDAMNAMKNGIDPGLISRLDSLGMNPADFAKYRIVTKDAAAAAETAINTGSIKTWKEFFDANPGKYPTAKEASDSYTNLVKLESPWPEGFTPIKDNLKPGTKFQMAFSPTQPSTQPGGFGTFDTVPDVNYVRNELAVKVNWKPSIDRVVVFEVTNDLPVQTGPVGPQIDLTIDTYLPGGGTQLQLLVPTADRMKYLKIVDEIFIH